MKEVVGKILDSRLITTIIILLILFFGAKFAFDKYSALKTEVIIAQQNSNALADSLRISTNKVGDLEFSKQILIADNNNDLAELNQELDDANKKYDGKVHELSILKGQIKTDTVFVDNIVLVEYPDGTKGVKWSVVDVYDEDNSRYLEGVTKFSYNLTTNTFEALPSLITRDEINFELTQGLRTTSDGKVEMFASSTYPNFSVSELNSVIIHPKTHPSLKKFTKKKKFHLGVYGGYGVTGSITTGQVMVGPQIGVGVTYTIW